MRQIVICILMVAVIGCNERATNTHIITAVKQCEEAGLVATEIRSGFDLIDIQCAPKAVACKQ